MGNSGSTSNNTLNNEQKHVLTKLETLLGGSDTETYVTNKNNEYLLNKFHSLLQDTEVNNNYNAVSGDTETLNNFVQPEPTINHAVFETTSDALPFTVSENLVPIVISNNNMRGGNNSTDTLNRLSKLLQDSETNLTSNKVDNSRILNRLSTLLENTETNNYAMNFRGGGLDSENLFTSEDLKGGNHNKQHTESEEKKKHESEEKKNHDSEKSKEPEESEESKQSGGEELDTELKNILMTLKQDKSDSKNVISGGKTKKGKKSNKKSDKKSSKKSATSKSSRRSDKNSEKEKYETSEDSDNESGDESDDESEEYLTSTSSLNTSDINVKHYR